MFKKLLSYIIPINLYRSDSKISRSIEVNLYNGELVMDSMHANYSYGSLQRILRIGLKEIGYDKIKGMQSALVLGLAAGSVVKTLVNEIGFTGKVVGVDIDHQVIKVAKKYFNIDAISNLEIVIDDAKTFIQNAKHPYDLIIVDVFQDREMPGFLFEETFVDKLHDLTNSGGVILFNTMKLSPEDNSKNQKIKLKFEQKNSNIFMISELEKYNELIIIRKRA